MIPIINENGFWCLDTVCYRQISFKFRTVEI